MATTKLLSGSWHVQDDGKTHVHTWAVGQQVTVQSRTWPGMNRPGGHGRISKLHYGDDGQVESIDVKYTLSGTDKRLEPYLVEPWHDVDRSHRRGGRGGGGDAVEPSKNKDHLGGVDAEDGVIAVPALPPSKTKNGTTGARAADEKENAIQDQQRSFSRRREEPQQHSRGRRPSIKPLASLKKGMMMKAASSSPAVSSPMPPSTPSSSSASEKTASVPLVIFADDERSIVSELETHTGAEEPPRSSYLTDSSGSGRRRTAHRGRLQSLETAATSDAATEVSRRSSPCSNAKSIVSGQLSVVGRRCGGGGARGRHGGAIPSPASYRKVEKRLLVTSPSTARCLAVGQVSPRAEAAAMAEAESRDDHKRSPSQSPRKRRPTSSATKLYVSELQPVHELACFDSFLDGRVDRRDDDDNNEDRHESLRPEPTGPEATPCGSPPQLDETMSCSSHDTRRNDFVSHLVDLLTDCDGVLDEDRVLELVNHRLASSSASAPYDATHLNEYLEYLSDQHKVFRSDGQVYLV